MEGRQTPKLLACLGYFKVKSASFVTASRESFWEEKKAIVSKKNAFPKIQVTLEEL